MCIYSRKYTIKMILRLSPNMQTMIQSVIMWTPSTNLLGIGIIHHWRLRLKDRPIWGIISGNIVRDLTQTTLTIKGDIKHTSSWRGGAHWAKMGLFFPHNPFPHEFSMNSKVKNHVTSIEDAVYSFIPHFLIKKANNHELKWLLTKFLNHRGFSSKFYYYLKIY